MGIDTSNTMTKTKNDFDEDLDICEIFEDLDVPHEVVAELEALVEYWDTQARKPAILLVAAILRSMHRSGLVTCGC